MITKQHMSAQITRFYGKNFRKLLQQVGYNKI